MTGAAHSMPGASGPVERVLALLALAAGAGYLIAAARLRRRGDAWPVRRDLAFGTGAAALAGAMAVPPPGGPFTSHMGHHLVAAMAAPLLLVLGHPLTLALRVLPPGRARRALPALARSRTAACLTFPPLAALLDVGGLWLLYRTPLFAESHHRLLAHAVVTVHVVAAGLLFAFAAGPLTALHRRWGPGWRCLALAGAGAVHGVLAKLLYDRPPPGTHVAPDDLRSGALLMYYGGDLVELCLAAALAASWYAAAGRARRRAEAPRGRPAAGTEAVAAVVRRS
ncbi:cytochrome c oxidase assembly protein [Streptomyces sp. URMC 126]|uniref:cytochrome c oxidase assembly protein n=1 Tax=Streptomyces sp. URMC 126 TaxID=3423401 RepID=UPI003F1DA2CF